MFCLSEVMPCARCGKGLMGPSGGHRTTCDIAGATVGHHRSVATGHRYASMVGPQAEIEPGGPIPDTAFRPADLLTSAAGAGYEACDWSCASPDAQNAGTDCTETRVHQKCAYYEPNMAHRVKEGITYRPLVMSIRGKPHSGLKFWVDNVAHRVARKRAIATIEPWPS